MGSGSGSDWDRIANSGFIGFTEESHYKNGFTKDARFKNLNLVVKAYSFLAIKSIEKQKIEL